MLNSSGIEEVLRAAEYGRLYYRWLPKTFHYSFKHRIYIVVLRLIRREQPSIFYVKVLFIAVRQCSAELSCGSIIKAAAS